MKAILAISISLSAAGFMLAAALDTGAQQGAQVRHARYYIDDAGGQQDSAARNNTAGAMRDEAVIGSFKALDDAADDSRAVAARLSA